MRDADDSSSWTPEAADRDVMGLTLQANADLLVGLLRGTHDEGGDPVLAALAASRSLALVVDDIQRSLVGQARGQGRTWAAVGQVLHVSRQAAFQRFGGVEPLDPRRDEDAVVLPGAAEAALRVLRPFVHERFNEMRSGFDARMERACPVELLQTVRRKLDADLGEFQETGTPAASLRAGYTVVDVPIAFARGDRIGRVAFNADSEVCGFFMLPPEGADSG